MTFGQLVPSLFMTAYWQTLSCAGPEFRTTIVVPCQKITFKRLIFSIQLLHFLCTHLPPCYQSLSYEICVVFRTNHSTVPYSQDLNRFQSLHSLSFTVKRSRKYHLSIGIKITIWKIVWQCIFYKFFTMICLDIDV